MKNKNALIPINQGFDFNNFCFYECKYEFSPPVDFAPSNIRPFECDVLTFFTSQEEKNEQDNKKYIWFGACNKKFNKSLFFRFIKDGQNIPFTENNINVVETRKLIEEMENLEFDLLPNLFSYYSSETGILTPL